jgi:hypothetical protein
MSNLTETLNFKALKINAVLVKHMYENNLILIESYKKDYQKWGLKRFSEQIAELESINKFLESYATKKTKSTNN